MRSGGAYKRTDAEKQRLQMRGKRSTDGRLLDRMSTGDSDSDNERIFWQKEHEVAMRITK
jgi:hypothetical protein